MFTSIIDNSMYDGEWAEGMRQGKGTLKLYNGELTEQLWTNDTLEEPMFGASGGFSLLFLLFFFRP